MPSPRRRWYRSLYWRIALGLFAFLALMLTAQGAAFLWMTDQVAGSMPAPSPRRLAVLVASDVGAALAADANLDIEAYIQDEYRQVLQTFVIIMRDGRVLANHDDVPAALVEAVQTEREFMGGLGPRRQGRRGGGFGPRGDGADTAGGDPGARGNGSGPGGVRESGARAVRRRGEFAPVIVGGASVGRVVVLPGRPSFARLLRRFGPTLALVGGTVLGVGTLLIAFVVFGPARSRLKEVEAATRRLGQGDLNARVPEHGGDEVAELARSFNHMAADLASRARALEVSDTARRQVLADVSHELMTPLTAMRGYVETLSMSEVQLDAATRERYLGIVTEETHRLERIIQDLLDLARLEGGGTAVRHDHVEVAALFSRVASRHERELRERGIRMVQRVDAGATTLEGDPDRLEQALQNLAANALRHAPDGGDIALGASPTAEGLRLTVRDSGPGIPPEHLALIFDRFYKADASRRAAGGSGLGLSIVRAIVERHGGRVTARNDHGAVFEIDLPSART
jgi:two-component system sensor histidine kinase BaeS